MGIPMKGGTGKYLLLQGANGVYNSVNISAE